MGTGNGVIEDVQPLSLSSILQPNDKPDSSANPKNTYFGNSLAWHTDGTDSLLAVGAPYHDACDGNDDDTGAVYVYKKDENGLCDQYHVKLQPNDKPNDANPTDTAFGLSLAWHSDGNDSFLAVGALYHDACDGYNGLFNNGDDTGAVYIYKDVESMSGVCDVHLVKLQPNDKPNDANPKNTYFGDSLAWHTIGNDSFLAVGAPRYDACDGRNENTGAVYIYKDVENMSGMCDNHLVKLLPNDKPNDANPKSTWFGNSLAWHNDGSDSFLAVGAPYHDACDGRSENTGAVYVYKDVESMSGVCDNHLVKLQPNDKPNSGANPNDTAFGWSLAWHTNGADSFLAVGAMFHDACDGRSDDTGAVYIYNDVESMSGVCDNHLVKLQPNDKPHSGANPTNTAFGYSLAWHTNGIDSFLAVGAPYYDTCDGCDEETGAVYIYKDVENMSGVCDVHLVKLQPNDKPNDADPSNTLFGWSLAWHNDDTGSFLAVGALFHDACDGCDEDTGAVYVYDVNEEAAMI